MESENKIQVNFTPSHLKLSGWTLLGSVKYPFDVLIGVIIQGE